MHSFAQMNGQHQHVGPPFQAFQAAAPLAQDATRNRVWLSGDNYSYITSNSGIQPSESGNVTSHNGAYSHRQMANWQNSAAPNQVVNSQNGGRSVKDALLRKMLQNDGLSDNSQNGNASPSAINGFPAALPQNFHQNSANQSTQNTINTKSTYLQQGTSSCWKPLAAVNTVQRTNVQAGQMMYHPQPNGVQQGFYQNANVGLTRNVSAYTTVAASPVVNSNMSVVHNGQAVQVAHNQIPRQTGTEQRFSPNYPASHAVATSQSSGISRMTAQPSNTQTSYASNMRQSTQKHTAQAYLKFKNWNNTSSSNMHPMNQSVARYVGATNELPPHPNVAPQQMPRPKESTDSRCTSYNTGSDRDPPPYRMHQHVGMARQSNWNTQTVTSLPSSEGVNMNISQSLPLHSGQSLPQSTVSKAQNTVNAQPLQNFSPNVSSITTVQNGSGRGETDQAHLPNNDAVSTGSPVESLSNAPQQINAPESVSLQRLFQMSFIAKHPEIIKVLGYNIPVLQNDGFTHSTPSHTGTRVVAVVQPLSQENTVTPLNATTCESGTNPEKDCISPDVAKNKEAFSMTEQACLHTENPNQTSSSNEKFNDVATLKYSDLEVHNLTRTSEPENEVVAVAENPSEITAVQGRPTKKNKRATPPSPTVTDLSSLPTTPWTAKALTKLILQIEKAQKIPEDVSKDESLNPIIRLWKEQYATLVSLLQDYGRKRFFLSIKNFCGANVTQETVILSQVKQRQLQHYHVLKDNDVYSEPPYKSFWLNLNDQLDDIDKDFGLPWAFRRHQSVLDTDSQMDQVKMAKSVPEPIVNKLPNTVLTESETIRLMEEKQAPHVETPSALLASLDDSENDDLSDSSYSFKIHVLSPEEAKALYEEVQKDMHQVIDFQKLTGSKNNSAQNVTKEVDAPSKECVGLIRSTGDQIDQVCCLAKLLEMQSGLSRPSLKCQCEENSATVLIPNTDSPGKSLEDDCQIISLSGPELLQIIDLTDSDNGLPFPSDQEPKIISEESNSSQSDVGRTKEDDSLSNNETVLPNEMANVAIEMTESVDQCAQEEFKLTETLQSIASVISVEQTNQCAQEEFKLAETLQSIASVINVEQTDQCAQEEFKLAETLQSIASVISVEQTNQCAQEEFKLAETLQSSASVINVEQTEVVELSSSDDEVLFQMSDQKEDCGKAQLQATDVAESSLKSKRETQIDGEATNQTSSSHHLESGTLVTTQTRQSILDQYFPPLNESKKYKVPVDLEMQNVSDVQCSPSEGKTVELVLFGSAKHSRGALFGNTKSHISSLETSSYENIVPPTVLSVNLNPLRRNSVEAPRTPEYSVKKLIYDKWRKSFPPLSLSMTRGHRKKWKIQRSFSAPLSSVNLQRKKQFVPSAINVSDGNGKCRLKLKRWSCSNGLNSKEAKKRKYSVELEQPADKKRSNTGAESQDAVSLKENIILKFSVLPNTFSFTDGSTWRNDTADPISDKPELAEEKDRTSNKAVKPKVGQWNPSPQRQYHPLCVPRKVGLFNEYQKKYKDKKQPAPQELPD